MIYLQRLGDATSIEQQTGKHSVVLGTVDIKDHQGETNGCQLTQQAVPSEEGRTRPTSRSKDVVLEF